MANRNRRPHRGPRDGRNILISGDVPGDLGSRQPQGGARPLSEEFRESGDLEAREFGVPQADIPGGVRHLVNPETIPHKPPGVYERPADYHKYHGVESDDGQYYPPPDDVGRPRGTVNVPKVEDAVPVYVVERAGKHRVRRDVSATNITVVTSGSDPSKLCNRDENRVLVMLLCDDPSNNVRFSEERATLAEGKGALLINSATSYLALPTQGELWATSTSASAKATLNVILVTEVPERSE